MEVLMAGSGTAVPQASRGGPGFLIDTGGAGILVDPSAGTVYRLARLGWSLERIRWLLFSHLHPDHTGDLVPILFALRNPSLRRRPESFWIGGPPGFSEFYSRLEAAYGSWIQVEETPVEIVEYAAEPFDLGPLRVSAFAVRHTANSHALRFESDDGGVFCYSGDTGPCEGVIEAAKNADLLLIECSFPDGARTDGHLTPTAVGEIARQVEARRVLLTHLYPECDGEDILGPIRRVFTGPVEIARDGGSYRWDAARI